MRLGLDVAQHQLDWPEILKRVVFAEDVGFDGAWVFDHFTALYGDPAGPCLEGWTLLAALAASTTKIRLGALVTGITHRLPSVLVTEAVTVDRISNGRLEFGVGAAWNRPEHEAFGIAFPDDQTRIEMLEEAIELMRAMMTEDGVTFQGSHYRLSNATYHPRPVQQPHPPVWIGAAGERLMLPLVARQADAWHSYGDVAVLERKNALLTRLAEEAGRDPGAILRSGDLSISEPWEAVRARAEGLRAAGFDYLTVDWPSEGWARVEGFASNLLSDIVEM